MSRILFDMWLWILQIIFDEKQINLVTSILFYGFLDSTKKDFQENRLYAELSRLGKIVFILITNNGFCPATKHWNILLHEHFIVFFFIFMANFSFS